MFAIIGWIGRILLILFIVRMVVSFFSGGARKPAPGAAGPASRGARGGHTEKTVAKLVRDPQCGTYVSETTAIAARHGGEMLHFCSDKCRDEYLAAPRATAV